MEEGSSALRRENQKVVVKSCHAKSAPENVMFAFSLGPCHVDLYVSASAFCFLGMGIVA